jgi:hypothetical protein
MQNGAREKYKTMYIVSTCSTVATENRWSSDNDISSFDASPVGFWNLLSRLKGCFKNLTSFGENDFIAEKQSCLNL